MLKRTPVLAIFITAALVFAVKYFFELSSRPFTMWQTVTLCVLCYTVALGIALLFDPKAILQKQEYLKINFYEEKPKCK